MVFLLGRDKSRTGSIPFADFNKNSPGIAAIVYFLVLEKLLFFYKSVKRVDPVRLFSLPALIRQLKLKIVNFSHLLRVSSLV